MVETLANCVNHIFAKLHQVKFTRIEIFTNFVYFIVTFGPYDYGITYHKLSKEWNAIRLQDIGSNERNHYSKWVTGLLMDQTRNEAGEMMNNG